MARHLARLLLLGSSLLLCLLLGELGLRLWAGHPSGTGPQSVASQRFNPFRSDATLGYVLRPGWTGIHQTRDFRVRVHINGLGLRGHPLEQRKPSGTLRIAILGDSYTFGFGVEDRDAFPALLERLLSRPERPVEVLNFDVPGYSTDHYWILLQQRVQRLSPDLLIVATCSNDLPDLAWNQLDLDPARLPLRTQSTLRMIDYRGRMRYLEGSALGLPGLLASPPAWLVDHSQLFNSARLRAAKVWLRLRGAERRAAAGEPPRGPIQQLTAAEIQRGLRSGPGFQLRYHRYLMAAIARRARALGLPLRRIHVGPGRGPLQEDCQRLGAECLSAESLFDLQHDPELFLPDQHWRAQAHRRLARAAARWLEPLLAGIAGPAVGARGQPPSPSVSPDP